MIPPRGGAGASSALIWAGELIWVNDQFPHLLKKAGIPGEFDPGSIRVVQQ